MRVSCNVHCLHDRPLRAALPAVRDSGCDAVEIDWRLAERDLLSARDKPAALQAMLQEHGLTVVALRIVDMSAVHESEVEQVAAQMRSQMCAARSLGVTLAVAGGGDRRQQPLAVLTAGLRAALEAADEVDLSLAVVNALDSSVEQIEDCRAVFTEVEHPRLRLALDAGQFQCAAVNPCNVIAEFADRLSLIRLNDRLGRRIVPLGQGGMNVSAVVQRARRSGYDGWLVIDADLPDPREVPQYLADARAFLQALLSDIQ